MWTIRPAQRGDAQMIAALADALSLQEGEPAGHFDAAAIGRDCFGQAAILTVWVAEAKTGLIGFAVVHAAYDTAAAQRGWWLQDLYVATPWRRQGVARALMATVIAAAKADGRGFLRWTSYHRNEKAQAFYASIGAQVEDLATHWLPVS